MNQLVTVEEAEKRLAAFKQLDLQKLDDTELRKQIEQLLANCELTCPTCQLRSNAWMSGPKPETHTVSDIILDFISDIFTAEDNSENYRISSNLAMYWLTTRKELNGLVYPYKQNHINTHI